MLGNQYYIAIHGHFYQPPRKNPWLGIIEQQSSAAPWHDWNEKINSQCYTPMARSRVRDSTDSIIDLYNNYAHLSFNFGPTLLDWLSQKHPELLTYLLEAVKINSQSALSQPYAHSILPLDNCYDRYTQIVWGIQEYYHRFKQRPKGMWLPECAINNDTITSLINQKIEYIILSPQQASRIRPFGSTSWQEVYPERIDTRQVYRVFEQDSYGKTYYDRYLNVIFYTSGLNLKISFDHLLTDTDKLLTEINNSYDKFNKRPQLVTIVTDGEIYGHHEANGEEYLSKFLLELKNDESITLTTISDFIYHNPPSWEVQLWHGDDNLGSSWSCNHGVGRWHTNCGCKSNYFNDWEQTWRQPLRQALNNLRDKINRISREYLGKFFLDVTEARNDYIQVILNPDIYNRERFLIKHSQNKLLESEVKIIWELLEAEHNTLLMYSSCAWFFDEISGTEPVQCLSFALRAAELANTYSNEDLIFSFSQDLSLAESNLPEFPNGQAVLDKLVKPGQYDIQTILSTFVISSVLGLNYLDSNYEVVNCSEIKLKNGLDHLSAWGGITLYDKSLGREITGFWFIDLSDLSSSGILFHHITYNYHPLHLKDPQTPITLDKQLSTPSINSWALNLLAMSKEEKQDLFSQKGVTCLSLPQSFREILYDYIMLKAKSSLNKEIMQIGQKSYNLITLAKNYQQTIEPFYLKSAKNFLYSKVSKEIYSSIADPEYINIAQEHISQIILEASSINIILDFNIYYNDLYISLEELIYCLNHIFQSNWQDFFPHLHTDRTFKNFKPYSLSIRQDLATPQDKLCQALSLNLAKIYQCRLDFDNYPESILENIKFLDLLNFSKFLNLPLCQESSLHRSFWDFMNKPLISLIQHSTSQSISLSNKENIFAIGQELGFSYEHLLNRFSEAEYFAKLSN